MSKKKQTIGQQAGIYRRKLKKRGIDHLKDYKGQEVPVDYIPPLELVKHFQAEELIDEAKDLQDKLAAFKTKCQQIGDDLHERMMEENDIRESSVGGFTVANFDKSRKVEFKMDTVQVVDSEQLAVAKEYKDRFIADEAGQVSEVISDLLNLAFETSDGKIDPRRGRALNKYRDRIKNKNFRKFLDHYNQAFELNYTKRFERFQERDDQGEYNSILLTYSSLKPKNEE